MQEIEKFASMPADWKAEMRDVFSGLEKTGNY